MHIVVIRLNVSELIRVIHQFWNNCTIIIVLSLRSANVNWQRKHFAGEQNFCTTRKQ